MDQSEGWVVYAGLQWRIEDGKTVISVQNNDLILLQPKVQFISFLIPYS